MDMTQTYALRDQDVAAEDFDGEVVVLDLANGRYFSLSAGAGAVWHALEGGHSLQTLLDGLPVSDGRREQVADVVTAFVNHGLMIARDDKSSIAADPVLLEFTEFTVDVYDDLAALLVADPIHDVDQNTGWPHQPTKRD